MANAGCSLARILRALQVSAKPLRNGSSGFVFVGRVDESRKSAKIRETQALRRTERRAGKVMPVVRDYGHNWNPIHKRVANPRKALKYRG